MSIVNHRKPNAPRPQRSEGAKRPDSRSSDRPQGQSRDRAQKPGQRDGKDGGYKRPFKSKPYGFKKPEEVSEELLPPNPDRDEKIRRIRRRLQEIKSYKQLLAREGQQPDRADKERESELIIQLLRLEKGLSAKPIPKDVLAKRKRREKRKAEKLAAKGGPLSVVADAEKEVKGKVVEEEEKPLSARERAYDPRDFNKAGPKKGERNRPHPAQRHRSGRR